MTCEKCSDPLFILSVLYGTEESHDIRAWLERRLSSFSPPPRPEAQLDQRDTFLTAAAGQFTAPGATPLHSLGTFAQRCLGGLFTGLHVVPYYHDTPGDGPGVTDPLGVDSGLGGWEDIEEMAGQFKLACDLVLNPISSRSPWFQGFLRGEERWQDFFITLPPETDLSEVSPLTPAPLLVPYEAPSGTRWVWSTFGPGKADLNYANTAVLQEMIEIMLQYVGHGARLLRLQGEAYVGKEMGMPCIHLSQAHLVVRLLRAILDRAAPGVKLLTGGPYSHAENSAYFGNGYNETHLLANFALPPLLLHSFAQGDASCLTQWAGTLQLPSTETLYFNFIPARGEISLDPVREILSQEELARLEERTLENNFFDALSDPRRSEHPQTRVARALAAHAILLALAGLPGVDVRTLLGSVDSTQSVSLGQVERALANPHSETSQVLQGLSQLVRARASSAAFHPYGMQLVLEVGSAAFGLMRISPDGGEIALCLTNVTAHPQSVVLDLDTMGLHSAGWQDALTGQPIPLESPLRLSLAGYQSRWLIPAVGS